MRLHKLLLVAGMSLTLSSCEFKCQVGNVKDDEGKDGKSAKNPVMQGKSALYNDIQISKNGLEFTKAWLAYADNGQRLPEGNIYEPGRKVEIVISGITGWTPKEDRVLVDASEMLIVENRDTILNQASLFGEKYPNGVSAEDARTIRLSSQLTLEKNSRPVSLSVPFRIWDRNGEASLEGSVTLVTK